jgi:hypothetical protein
VRGKGKIPEEVAQSLSITMIDCSTVHWADPCPPYRLQSGHLPPKSTPRPGLGPALLLPPPTCRTPSSSWHLMILAMATRLEWAVLNTSNPWDTYQMVV